MIHPHLNLLGKYSVYCCVLRHTVNKYIGPVIGIIVQELCESRGGRPELSVLKSLLVSVNVKLY